MRRLPAVESLSLAEAVGQVLCPTLFGAERRGEAYDAGREAEALARYGWGGVILFHGEAATTRERVAALQAVSRVPLLVAADLEHGAGQQLAGRTAFPPAMAFGAAGSLADTEALGAWTAREALDCGINWVLAPVADVNSNPLNPIISIRAFGGDPRAVAAHAAAFVRGCQSQGALACAKHFPGHGDTSTDSHSRLGVLDASLERLEALEWVPFRAAIEADVATIMSAHLALPALAPRDRPATLSRAVMTGVLRERLGFGGLVVSDALLMGGIERVLGPDDAVVQAVAAGCDMLLMPRDPAGAHQALVRAVATGRLSEARLYEAAGRVLAAKSRLAPGAAGPDGLPDALASRVAAGAITLAKGEPGLRVPDGALVLAVDDGAEPDRLAALASALAAEGLALAATVRADTPEQDWARLRALAATAPGVLVVVLSPVRVSKDRTLLAESLLGPLQALVAAAPTVVASASSPFVVSQFPEAQGWVLSFGSRPVQLAALVRALRTGAYPGTAPVALPDHLGAAPETGPMGTGPAFA